MKRVNIKKLILILCLAFSSAINSQNARLRLTINNYSSDDSTCVRLLITKVTDTITDKIIYTSHYYKFDSLSPGPYKIRLFSCSYYGEPELIRNFSLLPNQETNLNIEYSATEETYYFKPKNIKEEYNDRTEGQINLSFLNPHWIDKSSSLSYGATLSLVGYKWFSFSKHFGLLTGLGAGFSNYKISSDTTFMNLTSANKKWEYYNYLHIDADFKFRITMGSQQKHAHVKPRTVLDFGVVYYVPVVFRHVAGYDNNKKIINKYLHQYTDLRTHIDFGISPVILYAEYRMLDFIIKPYPEIPKYTVGIKLTVH